MIRTRHVLMSVAVATMATLAAGDASAQDQQAAVDKLVQMNKKALDDYDTLEWDSAKNTLLDALRAGKKAGLDSHPVMARTYVHLGAVYITGFKNREKAIQSFSRALEIDPSIQLSKGIATSEVNDLFNEARRSAGGGGGAPPPAPGKRKRGPAMEGDEPPPARKSAAAVDEDDEDREPDLPVRINALECPIPDEAILDKPVVLRCAVAPTLPVVKVVVKYREPGKDEPSEAVLTKTPKGWYQGKVPKKAMTGKSLYLYFEGYNAAGKKVVENGNDTSPNSIPLMEEEAYKAYLAKKKKTRPGEEEEEENPLIAKVGPAKNPLFGRQDPSLEGLDTRFGQRKWWFSIGVGSGFGYAKGEGLEAVNMSPDPQFHSLQSVFVAGGAWAGLGHMVPEVGIHLTPNLAVSVAGRLQYIPQPPEHSRYGARGAWAVLGKFLAYTKQSRVRFFGAALAGGGEGFRFVVKPVQDTENLPPAQAHLLNFQDSVRGGPGVAGLGAGVYYEAANRVSIVLEADGLAGFPIFSFVADVTLSLQVNFYGGGGGSDEGKIDPNSSAGRKLGEDTE
jgi:tetratricopeptide (TPR) repeat protein